RLLTIALVVAALAGSGGATVAPPPLSVADAGLPPGVARGAARYFAWVSAHGGVAGRPIAFRPAVPGGRPLAVLTARGLPEPVPQLVLGGSTAARGRPWALGYVPGYGIEARVLARQILKTRPGASIAVLYSDDADGRELLARFERAAPILIASTDPETVRTSRADTLVVLGSRPRALPRRDWFVFANAASAEPVPGAVSTVFVRTPGDPVWAGDREQRRFAPANAVQALGLAAAYSTVAALRRAGPQPTRARVLAALRRSAEADNPFLVPGIVV